MKRYPFPIRYKLQPMASRAGTTCVGNKTKQSPLRMSKNPKRAVKNIIHYSSPLNFLNTVFLLNV